MNFNVFVKMKKLDVVSYPEISMLDKVKENEWGYKAVVAVFPKCDPKDYFGIEAKLEETNITEESVNNEVNRLLETYGLVNLRVKKV